MPKEVVIPKNAHRTRGYSHAYKCGNTIYIAGQIGWDEPGTLIEWEFKRGFAPLLKNLPPLLIKEGGIKRGEVHREPESI